MDHIKLICDINELNHLFRDSISVENFMQRTVEMVADHLATEVCSIYIYDDDEQRLVLKATTGLNTASVGKISLDLGEGLTGLALKELRPIYVCNASTHPNYKFFSGLQEEDYETFLAVPITRGIQRIGVLVLQRKERMEFAENELLACKAVASQLANIIENAKFLMTIHLPQAPQVSPSKGISEDLKFIHGRIASGGFAYAGARVVDKEKTFAYLVQRHYTRKYSNEDFHAALEMTRKQLEILQHQIEEKLSDAASLIFASHLMILKDHEFIGAMERLIDEGENPPEAVLKIASEYISIFSSSKNAYIREKVKDVEDLTVRLVGNLIREVESIADYNNKVLIARDLFPSDLLRLSSEEARGIVLVSGGVTSHLSILARSLQIPMVIANKPELMEIPNDTPMLVDGHTGYVYTAPEQSIVEKVQARNKQIEQSMGHEPDVKDQTFTKDGERVILRANINLVSDLELAERMKSEGIGLYRTEFPFVIRNDFPSENEQYTTYRKLVQAMPGRPVVFRTLDIGGDKVLSYFQNAYEQNPSLGLRSIRFSLQNKEVFSEQIRAMLRAGLGGDLRIMFPMISSPDEFCEAYEVVTQCSRELADEGAAFNDSPMVGMMIEIPSVVPMLDVYARHVDFFSIGTNDFIQFMLGVDRTNENVESFYIPHHPAVLRSLSQIAQACGQYGRELSLCGDMAGQTEYIPFLLGIGITVLSMDPGSTPRIQKFISGLDMAECRKVAERVLACSSVREVEAELGLEHEAVYDLFED